MKRWKSVKLGFKTLISLTAIIMTIIFFSITSIVMYNNTIHYLRDKTTSISHSNMNQIAKKLEIYFSEFENMAERLSSSRVLKEKIQSYDEKKQSSLEKIQRDILQIDYRKEMEEILNVYRKYTDGIESISVILPGDHFYSGEQISEDIIFEDIDQDFIDRVLSPDVNKPVLFYLQEDAVAIHQDLFVKENVLAKGGAVFASRLDYGQDWAGIIIVKISQRWLRNNFGKGYQMAILGDGNVFYQSNRVDGRAVTDALSYPMRSEEGIIEGAGPSNSRGFYKKLYWKDWYMIYFEDLEASVKKLDNFRNLSLLLFAVGACISVLLSCATLDKMIRPFKLLIENVRKYGTDKSTEAMYISGRKSRLNLRERILVFYMATIIGPLLVHTALFCFISWDTVKDELIRSKEIAFRQTAENIELYMERKLKVVSNMSYDRVLQESLLQEDGKVDMDRLYEAINEHMLFTSGYDDICIYNLDNKKLAGTYNRNYSFEENRINQKNVMGKIAWTDMRKDELNRFTYGIHVKINGSGLDSPYTKYLLKHIGNIVVSLNESDLEQIYKELYIKGDADISIMDVDGQILSNIDKSRIGHHFEDAYDSSQLSHLTRNRLIFEMDIKGTPWVLKEIYQYESLLKDFKPILIYNFFLLAMIFLFLVIAAYEISLREASTVSRMNEILRTMDTEDLTPGFPEGSHISEVDELGRAFNDMMVRMETLIDDLLISRNRERRMEEQKKDAEILALQSQIKPHFLSNTMESIRCLISENKGAQAIEMIRDLCDLFTYGISKVENLIPVEQELAYAAAYTRIMGMRFENEITFEWHVEEETKKFLTPKLVLQPVIENAIYHGLVQKKESGVIRIECLHIDRTIRFSISDNGAGMSEGRLDALKEALEEDEGKRIGLANVQKRLKLYFGEEYGITVSSLRGGGTTVCIKIPEKINPR